MTRILAYALLSLIFVSAMYEPVLAQTVDNAEGEIPYWAHWSITLLGMGVAARLAFQAFGRAVSVENLPTVPRYMTSRRQYWLGVWAFVAFACAFFFLLIQEHREVLPLVKSLNILSDNVIGAVDGRSNSYLAIVVAMVGVYLFGLTYEKPWNVLLIMRDVIQSSISVPQLAKKIMAQIQFSLQVPQDAARAVVEASKGVVVEQDFSKDVNTPDRKWAETCYMKWWLTQGRDAGDDATFFTESSFGFDKLVADFRKTAPDMRQWKAGAVADLQTSDVLEAVNDLHRRFSRLVACYLIYRYGSRQELIAAARKFGVTLSDKVSVNPLGYWIVYVIALAASVYIGVHASAIAYDVLKGQGLNLAQDSDLAFKWVMYSITNYGLAIIVILMVRMLARSLDADVGHSHLVTYCWTFAIAFVVGPAGLTVAVYFFAPSGFWQDKPLYLVYYGLLKWGLGPALVCAYISYYLDRQIYADLPNIVHSSRTFVLRLLNCFGFALFTLFVLLPPLLEIQPSAEAAAWDVHKLRFVAGGATFFVALGLALAAQFALRKPAEPQGVAAASPIAA